MSDKDLKYQGYIGIADRQRLETSLLGGIMFAAYSDKLRLEPIIITDHLEGVSVKIFKSLGFKKFLTGFDYNKIFTYNIIVIKSILFFFFSLSKIINLNFDHFIKKYKVKNILVGDLIYDSFIRYNLGFKNPKVNFNFLKIVFKTIFRVYNICAYVDKYKFKLIFANTDTYASNSAILLRVGVKKKIKCYLLTGYKYLQKIVKYKPSNINRTSNELRRLGILPKDLINFKITEKFLNKFLRDRFNGTLKKLNRTGYNDLINSNLIKKNKSKKQLFKKLKINRSYEKIVLIAPHAFSDAPHGSGNFIFRDYYQQFIKTIEFIESKNFNNILWLVRPHPSSRIYGETNLIREIIDNLHMNKKNFFYCPIEIINTRNLIKICDHVITGRGTIGLEFACYKKTPLVAGAYHFDGFNLALKPKNQLEYFKFIEQLIKIKPMDKKSGLMAKKILYYFETIYPDKINGHSIKHNQKSRFFKDKISNPVKDNSIKLEIINKLAKYNFKDDELYKSYYISA